MGRAGKCWLQPLHIRHLINLAATGVVLLAASSVATTANASFLHWFTKGPTQKELFELRTQCAQLAKAKENELTAKNREAMLDSINTSSSQYDVTNNRCYVEIEQNIAYHGSNTSTLRHALFDGQSGQVLASTEERMGPFGLPYVEGAVADPQHHSRIRVGDKDWLRGKYNEAMDYINDKMGANRLIP